MTKTILITGHRTELEQRPGQLPAVDAICYKPFDVDELLATIRRLTETRLQ